MYIDSLDTVNLATGPTGDSGKAKSTQSELSFLLSICIGYTVFLLTNEMILQNFHFYF